MITIITIIIKRIPEIPEVSFCDTRKTGLCYCKASCFLIQNDTVYAD